MFPTPPYALTCRVPRALSYWLRKLLHLDRVPGRGARPAMQRVRNPTSPTARFLTYFFLLLC